MSTLHEDQHTFLIISHLVIIRVGIVSDESNKNQNTYFIFSTFFWKSFHLWDKVVKYCRAGQATGDSMAHVYCMLDIW